MQDQWGKAIKRCPVFSGPPFSAPPMLRV